MFNNKIINSFFNHSASNFFIIEKYTYSDIFSYAQDICQNFSSNDCICIATHNKGIIAAAFIASLCGGPKLIIPYSYSVNILEEVSNYNYFSHIITDVDINTKLETFTPSAKSTVNLKLKDTGDSPIVTLFTGGTTGTPQAYEKSASNILEEALNIIENFQINSNYVFISTVPANHIYGFLFTIAVPLLSGASILDRTYTFPEEIIKAIEQYNPTILISVPIHYKMIHERLKKDSPLKLAISSAGMLDKEIAENFYHNSQVKIHEIFGSTETGGIASRCRGNNEENWTPFKHIKWKINDKKQLCIKSKFIYPQIVTGEDQFFITNDRVSMVNDQEFELLGRIDNIIKIGGKRVDLGRVKEKISRLENINDLYLIPITTKKSGEQRIAGLFVGDIDRKNLTIALLKILEPYEVPRVIKFTNKIPTRSNGKIDKSMVLKLIQT